MSRSDKRRRLIVTLSVAVVAMALLFPVVFPALPSSATQLDIARRALNSLVYICVILLILGSIAITGAREIKDVFEEYRERKRRALDLLIDDVSTIHPRGNGNAKPLE